MNWLGGKTTFPPFCLKTWRHVGKMRFLTNSNLNIQVSGLSQVAYAR